jgi:hypothetical protein
VVVKTVIVYVNARKRSLCGESICEHLVTILNVMVNKHCSFFNAVCAFGVLLNCMRTGLIVKNVCLVDRILEQNKTKKDDNTYTIV